MGKVRVGECSQCGACCDNFRALCIQQKAQLEGFHVVVGSHFPCYKSHMEDGKSVCSIYEERPQMCRAFPWSEECLIDFPECSYRFVDAKEKITIE